jgi:hypothetical protein
VLDKLLTQLFIDEEHYDFGGDELCGIDFEEDRIA